WEDPTHLVNGDSLTPDVFSIYIKRDGLLIDSVSGGVGQYTDTGLTDGQMYHYEIYSRVDTTGATSEGVTASWIAGGSPIPSPPINFSVSGGQQEITLTWTVPTTNVDGTPMDDYAGVNLYRNGVFVDFLGGATSDTGAVMSVNYSPNPPGLYEWFITIVDNESPPNESAPSDTMGTPLNIPLGDMFDVPGTPNPGMWITEYTEINDRSNNPPTGSLALNLNGQPIGEDIIDLKPVDLTGLEGSGIALNYWYQPQGNGNAPEENDSLRVYFKNDQGEWVLVAAYPGSPLQPFMQETIFLDSVSAQGGTYFFSQFQVRFRSTGGAGNFPNDDWFIDDVTLAPVVGIGDEELATETFHLNQNYPNPFNPETQIEFSIPKAEMVSLKVYDVLGREIQTLVKGRLTPGKYQIRWDGRDQHGQPVASGVYFYRLKTRDFAQIRKMILLR
ncbi:MAG: T9SS C-terminal target domain-containing protein, partial [Calditrichaeota bacterium]